MFEQDVGYADAQGGCARRRISRRPHPAGAEVSDGGWTLPGGWADVNQSASECVEREIREESGFEARAVKLAAVYDYRRQGHAQSAAELYI